MKKILFTCLAVAMFDGRLEAMNRSSVTGWDAHASELRELANQSRRIQEQLAVIDKQVRKSVQIGLAQGQQGRKDSGTQARPDLTDSKIQSDVFSQVGSLIELHKSLPDGSAKDLLGRANDLIEAFHKFEERDHLKEEIARIPSEVQRIRNENARLEKELNDVNRLIGKRRLVIDELSPYLEPIDRLIADIIRRLGEEQMRIQKIREATDFNRGVLRQYEEDLQRARALFQPYMPIFLRCKEFLDANGNKQAVPNEILEEINKLQRWNAYDVRHALHRPNGYQAGCDGDVRSCKRYMDEGDYFRFDTRCLIRDCQSLFKSIDELKDVKSSVVMDSSEKTSRTFAEVSSVFEKTAEVSAMEITERQGWKMVEGLESLLTGNAVSEQLSVAWEEREKLDEELGIVRSQYKELSVLLSEIREQNTDLNAKLCDACSELESLPERSVLIQSKIAQVEELLGAIHNIPDEAKRAEDSYREIFDQLYDFAVLERKGKAGLLYFAVNLNSFKSDLRDVGKYRDDCLMRESKRWLNLVMESLSESK